MVDYFQVNPNLINHVKHNHYPRFSTTTDSRSPPGLPMVDYTTGSPFTVMQSIPVQLSTKVLGSPSSHGCSNNNTKPFKLHFQVHQLLSVHSLISVSLAHSYPEIEPLNSGFFHFSNNSQFIDFPTGESLISREINYRLHV